MRTSVLTERDKHGGWIAKPFLLNAVACVCWVMFPASLWVLQKSLSGRLARENQDQTLEQ